MADSETGADLSDTHVAGLHGGVFARFTRDAGLLIRPDDSRGHHLTTSPPHHLPAAPPLVADRTAIDDLVTRVDQVLDRTTDWLREHP
jgi:adenosylmethionine-8-amino-7-oxononanoate aminotransferase